MTTITPLDTTSNVSNGHRPGAADQALRPCAQCGTPLSVGSRDDRRFCDNRCQMKWHRVQKSPARECEWCRQEFRPRGQKRFCSGSCRHEAYYSKPRVCSGCNELKQPGEFFNKHAKCKRCAGVAVTEWKRANPEKAAEGRKRWRERNPHYGYRHSLREFGLTLEDYQRMLDEQGGVCAICGSPPNGRRLAVDHDHETDRVRGLLCFVCNTGIGRFGESVATLQRAIAYLKTAGTA